MQTFDAFNRAFWDKEDNVKIAKKILNDRVKKMEKEKVKKEEEKS